MAGIQTRCRRIVCEDDTTELWRPPSLVELISNFRFASGQKSLKISEKIKLEREKLVEKESEIDKKRKSLKFDNQ